jgi:hypothetical protein
MEKDLTQLEIKTIYNRIVNDGVSELEGIKPFEIRQVFQYAEKINMDAVRFCAGQLDANQNFNYPPEYPENRQIEYWFSLHPYYEKSKYVIDLLNQKYKEIKSGFSNQNIDVSREGEQSFGKRKDLGNRTPEEFRTYSLKLMRDGVEKYAKSLHDNPLMKRIMEKYPDMNMREVIGASISEYAKNGFINTLKNKNKEFTILSFQEQLIFIEKFKLEVEEKIEMESFKGNDISKFETTKIFNKWVETKINYLKNIAPIYLNNNSVSIDKVESKNQSEDFTGFQSSLIPNQIESMFKHLKGNYIGINTNEDNFKAIFKNESITNNYKIHWISKTNNLAYFFWKLRKLNLIECRDLGLKLSILFTNKKGEKIKNTMFNKHFSDFQSNNGFPTDASTIEKIINSSTL